MGRLASALHSGAADAAARVPARSNLEEPGQDRTDRANDRPPLADVTPHRFALPKHVVAPREYAWSHLRIERHANAEVRRGFIGNFDMETDYRYAADL